MCSVQFSRSVVSDSLQPLGLQHARLPSPSPTPRDLLKLMSIELVMPSNHLILCCPLLLPPSLFPSIRVFSNESVLRIRWPKYWSFSFNISPSSEFSGLISIRMIWLDLLAVQGTLKSVFSNTTVHTQIYMCVNIRYLFFSFWLTSFCVTVSRSIHVSANGTTSFLSMSKIFLIFHIFSIWQIS